MKTSLIISTYNWKEALRLCLLSVTRQTVMPAEVIIADDGSKPDTKRLIDEFRSSFPCPLIHIWHEDTGWRKCTIMNKAFAICSGDYIIEVDGDIIMHTHFIEDHVSEACSGSYLAGSRGKIGESLSRKLLLRGDYQPLNIFSSGISRRLNIVRLPFLTPLFYRHDSARGCNLSFWKEDIFMINGYDERIVGYGLEDTDLVVRLERLGLKRKFIKFKSIEYHIHHKDDTTKKDMSANGKIYLENNRKHAIKCIEGIDKYITPEGKAELLALMST